jgi:hypothetical protein
MKAKQKLISIGCATLAIAIIAASAMAALAISHNGDNNGDSNRKKPNGRQNYDHELIGPLVSKDTIVSKCIDYKDNTLNINEQKYRDSIESIIRSALKKVNKFESNADSYSIELNYQFVNSKTIATDVV